MGLLSTLLEPLGPYCQELSKLGTPLLLVFGTVSFIVLSVVFNVLDQLLFKDPTKPPMVFHYFPFFGSTIRYGMDPYVFFQDCQEKVWVSDLPCIALASIELTVGSMVMCLRILCLEGR